MSNTTEDTFDFQEYLQSDDLADRRDHSKVLSTLLPVTGSISVIGSSAIIWHILRSHKGLSTTYHRLVFGLCVGDLMSSLAWAFNSTAAPKEFDYLAIYARGTLQTCSAQGFFLYVGTALAGFYNCALCFYYLAIITYNKKDDYIKAKLEPWFHRISVTNALTIGITGLVLKIFNIDNNGGVCIAILYDPPHCEGYDNGIIPDGFSIPCGRGDTDSANLFTILLHLMPLIINPAVVVGTMVTMYRTVRSIERKMLNYGAGALRLRAQQRQGIREVDNDHVMIGTTSTLICRLKSIKCPCLFWNHTASRSNNARSQKRAVLYMAMNYALTWALVFVPMFLRTFVMKNNRVDILVGILQPLQGLYTFFVYMSPKVRHARIMKRSKLPRHQAFTKALLSRGEKDKTIRSRRRQKMKTSRIISSISSLLSLRRLRNFLAARSNNQVVARTGDEELEKRGELPEVRNQIMVGMTLPPATSVEKIDP